MSEILKYNEYVITIDANEDYEIGICDRGDSDVEMWFTFDNFDVIVKLIRTITGE